MNKRRLTVIRADELLGADGLRQLSGAPPGRPTIIPPARPPRPPRPPTTPAATRRSAVRAPTPPPAAATAQAIPITSNTRALRLIVMGLLTVQTILAALLFIPTVSQDIAGDLYGMAYHSDPALAKQLYEGYLQWHLVAAALCIACGLTAMFGVAQTGAHLPVLILGILYSLPLILLFVVVALIAVLAIASIILGLVISIGATILVIRILSAFLK